MSKAESDGFASTAAATPTDLGGFEPIRPTRDADLDLDPDLSGLGLGVIAGQQVDFREARTPPDLSVQPVDEKKVADERAYAEEKKKYDEQYVEIDENPTTQRVCQYTDEYSDDDEDNENDNHNDNNENEDEERKPPHVGTTYVRKRLGAACEKALSEGATGGARYKLQKVKNKKNEAKAQPANNPRPPAVASPQAARPSPTPEPTPDPPVTPTLTPPGPGPQRHRSTPPPPRHVRPPGPSGGGHPPPHNGRWGPPMNRGSTGGGRGGGAVSNRGEAARVHEERVRAREDMLRSEQELTLKIRAAASVQTAENHQSRMRFRGLLTEMITKCASVAPGDTKVINMHKQGCVSNLLSPHGTQMIASFFGCELWKPKDSSSSAAGGGGAPGSGGPTPTPFDSVFQH